MIFKDEKEHMQHIWKILQGALDKQVNIKYEFPKKPISFKHSFIYSLPLTLNRT